ncbi:hypothetical protein EVAR_34809_1 [Eumeta japonica]|uniref:Uncharacterized protein n=1 Tax=Eumeta variegata TaxID=151549 RepID=A0A4C1WA97_EUMVA|nr:hypothetical protein EVAR_34809_1 [Eumeta japonica]
MSVTRTRKILSIRKSSNAHKEVLTRISTSVTRTRKILSIRKSSNAHKEVLTRISTSVTRTRKILSIRKSSNAHKEVLTCISTSVTRTCCVRPLTLFYSDIGRWSGREIARSALSLARSVQAERDNESWFFLRPRVHRMHLFSFMSIDLGDSPNVLHAFNSGRGIVPDLDLGSVLDFILSPGSPFRCPSRFRLPVTVPIRKESGPMYLAFYERCFCDIPRSLMSAGRRFPDVTTFLLCPVCRRRKCDVRRVKWAEWSANTSPGPDLFPVTVHPYGRPSRVRTVVVVIRWLVLKRV